MDTIKIRKKYLAFVGAAAVAGVLLLSACRMLSLSSAQPQEQGQEQQQQQTDIQAQNATRIVEAGGEGPISVVT